MQRDYKVKVIVPGCGVTVMLYKRGLDELERTGVINDLLFIVNQSDLHGDFSWKELIENDKTGRAGKIFDQYAAVYGL